MRFFEVFIHKTRVARTVNFAKDECILLQKNFPNDILNSLII